MTSDWQPCTLGDVAAVNPENINLIDDSSTIKYIDLSSVSREEGIDTSQVNEYVCRDAPGRARRLVRENDVLVATVRPYLRGFAQVGKDLDGQVASTGFAVLRAGERVEPGFVWLIVDSQGFIAHLMARATGSNYPAVRPDDVRSFPLLLPSLPEQRRIVDLVAGFDEVNRMSDTCFRAVRQTLSAVEEAFVTTAEGPSKALGELVHMRSGPSWKREQEGSVATPTSVPVIGITDTPADGRLVMGARTFVDGLPAGVQLLDDSSLVLIRTNGNRRRIGNVYRATPEVEGCAVSAFQIAVRPHKASDRDYLFRVLQAPFTQASITQAASGSTGLGNIAIGWLKALEIPWPDDQGRMEFVETCERLEAVAEGYRRLVEAVWAARSTLLEGLLSGALTLPGTYDRFLEAV